MLPVDGRRHSPCGSAMPRWLFACDLCSSDSGSPPCRAWKSWSAGSTLLVPHRFRASASRDTRMPIPGIRGRLLGQTMEPA